MTSDLFSFSVIILAFYPGFCLIAIRRLSRFLSKNHQLRTQLGKGVPQHSQIQENPQNNPVTHLQPPKKISEKPNPCPPLNPCLNFCPSPQADGHIHTHIYRHPVL